MSDQHRRVLVWDLPLRIFHWGLVICLSGSWITAEAGFDWTQWHFYFGYATLTLLLFRILWGFFGPTYARFSSFLLHPQAVWQSATELFSSQAHQHPGHNPLGSIAVVVMLASIATQATTGLFVSDDIFWAGPYNGAVTSDTAGQLAQIHHLNFDLLVTLVVLHVVALLWYRLRKGERLVSAMVTGYKHNVTGTGIDASASLRGLCLFVVSALAITAFIYFSPPPAPVTYF